MGLPFCIIFCHHLIHLAQLALLSNNHILFLFNGIQLCDLCMHSRVYRFSKWYKHLKFKWEIPLGRLKHMQFKDIVFIAKKNHTQNLIVSIIPKNVLKHTSTNNITNVCNKSFLLFVPHFIEASCFSIFNFWRNAFLLEYLIIFSVKCANENMYGYGYSC